jgi:ABC-type multidrug transport system fused ATPase/permease subunit
LSPEVAHGTIEWCGVSFHYRSEMPVLRSIDLRVEPGMKVAVVGPTGAAKSTMLGLLPRFFDPSTGSVTIDGVDVREFSLKSLRRQIAMVLQPPLIFPISVRDQSRLWPARCHPGGDRGGDASRQHPPHDFVAAAGLRHGDR